MNTNFECECSEEYGPCEEHGVVLAQREGGSTRTADELSLAFIADALDIDGEILSPYGRDVVARCEADLMRSLGQSRWLDDVELQDELASVAYQVEAALDAQVYWEDGYVISRVTGGPLSD
jgi:hypothetical protein